FCRTICTRSGRCRMVMRTSRFAGVASKANFQRACLPPPRARRASLRNETKEFGNDDIGRYWEHVIRNNTDLARHIDYIHFNPVKHGLVSRVHDWPYSSFHEHVKRGDLPADWGGDMQEIIGEFGE